MANYKVNPATVSTTGGLKLRRTTSLRKASIDGLLKPGDIVEATGPAQNAPPIVWLPVRVLSSANIASGRTGFTTLSRGGKVYLVQMDEFAFNLPVSPTSPLLDATAQVAAIMQLPALLLKAFMGVEGADINHRDGVLQVTPGTRPGVIGRIARANKLLALNMPPDAGIDDADLNAQFARAFEAKNLVVQVMTGAQYIKEQLDRFNGYVALAGLAYNAGPGGARSVVNNFGGDPFLTALQYHRRIGPGGDQVTVQAGIDQVDSATGAHWTRFPVIANDSGKEIFQYLYLRKVPQRGNFGLLDFIFNPSLLAARSLFQDDQPPGEDTGQQALVVVNGQFKLVGGQSTAMFNTTPLSQRDPQWKAAILGFGDASTTIGSDGCTLTCLTMVANGFGFGETPGTLNDKLKGLGNGRGFSGPLMVWSGLPAALPGMRLNNIVKCRDTPAPMAEIDAALDAGKPVVVELDQSPQPDFQNHWVVLFGRQGGDYLIHDPWPVPAEVSASLVQRYGFTGSPVPAQIITAAVFYDNPNTQQRQQDSPMRAPASTPGAPFIVVVNDDPEISIAGGLALREAAVNGAVKMRLAPGTGLEVREALDGALPKLGQQGQWLRVSNSEGVPGFVAAWLVHARAAAFGFAVTETGEAEGVADPSLVGVTQSPLRRALALVVVVNRPAMPKAAKKVTKKGAKKSGRKTARPVNPPDVVLRARPPRGKVIATLKPGAKLTVAEPSEAALAKVGKRGQWLNVFDSKGREGFVSAGSVHLTPEKKRKATSFRSGPGGEPHPIAAEGEDAVVAPVSFGVSFAPAEAPATHALVMVIAHPDIAAAGGLALRDAPVNGTIKMRLPAGTALELCEPAEGGLPKVGQVGEWLRVCTDEGVPGHVAAWYVKRVDISTPPEMPPTSLSPEIIAQGVVIASAGAPLLSEPRVDSPSEWRVSAGTPLRVIESDDWASKLGQAGQFVRVLSYAFKDGFVQGSLLKAPGAPDTRVPVVDARLPRGECAALYGLHDSYDRGLFGGTGKTGWVLLTERVVSGAGNTGYQDWASNGYGVIARLNNDYGGSGTIPTPDQHDAFAAQCASWVRNSRGCHTWVIANEMNNPREWPEEGRNMDKAITPELYAACFNKTRAAIKAVQPTAIVLPGALDCFQGPRMSCLEWFNRMLAAIDDLDGFALHCYTNGYEPHLVTDLGRFGDDPLRWQYFHFRAYTTFLDVIPEKWRRRPVFITETDPHGTSPWAGGQNGWVQAAYAEINRWNEQPHAQQIRTLILYRWSRDDIYSISDKPGVQNDIRATAAGTDYRWRQ